MKVFVFDSSRCNGCYNCQIACKDEHCGNDWSPIAKPQPDTGHFWCNMTEEEAGQYPKVRVNYRPIMCNHCDACALVEQAPECVYKREDGLVIIDPVKASGRKDLVDLCPLGAVYWNAELDIPQKCTGCAHLVDEGGVPHCVDLCATEALRFGELEDFADVDLEGATMLLDEGFGPRFYVLNDPKHFIAGEIWDPSVDECVEDATIVLTRTADGERFTAITDAFGDFWFKRLDAGTYELEIAVDGYEPVVKIIELDKSLNLGDYPLTKLAK